MMDDRCRDIAHNELSISERINSGATAEWEQKAAGLVSKILGAGVNPKRRNCHPKGKSMVELKLKQLISLLSAHKQWWI